MPEEVFENPQPIEPTSKNWPKIILVAVLGFAILAGAAYTGYWYGTESANLKTQSAKPQLETQIPDTPTTKPTPTSVPAATSNSQVVSKVQAEFEKYKEIYDGEFYLTNDSRVWWISSDNLNITNENSPGAELHLFNCEPNAQGPNFKETAQQVGLRLDDVMKQNGFEVDAINSSESVEDERFYDHIRAYQKGEARCVFKANPDCRKAINEERFYYNLSFACTDQFTSNYQEQAPYLRDLGINNAVIRVAKKLGSFVYLDVDYRRTGIYTIAKLIEGKWAGVYAGQSIPTCEVLRQYQVPNGIINNCLDEDTGEILRNDF